MGRLIKSRAVVFLSAVASLLFLNNCSAEESKKMELKSGQVWSVEEPLNDVEILIGRIDIVAGETVVSVMASGVPVPEEVQSQLRGRKTTTFNHIPIHVDALQNSLKSLLRQNVTVPSEFEEGYAYWQASIDDADASHFTKSLQVIFDDAYTTILTGERI